VFQLFAKSPHPRATAIDAVRQALDAAGARHGEVRPYPGHSVVIEVQVPVDAWVDFIVTMARPWDAFEIDVCPEPDAAPPRAEGATITGTLHLTLLHESGEGPLPSVPPLPGTG
jgi:hypothetical protein